MTVYDSTSLYSSSGELDRGGFPDKKTDFRLAEKLSHRQVDVLLKWKGSSA
jgi:hypothetical protein